MNDQFMMRFQNQMFIPSILVFIAIIHLSNSCIATPPVGPPSFTTTEGPEQVTEEMPEEPMKCQCSLSLYNDCLCPNNTICSRTGMEIIYDTKTENCPVTINCEADSFIAIRYDDGTSFRDLPIDRYNAEYFIMCDGTQWILTMKATGARRIVTGVACYHITKKCSNVCLPKPAQSIKQACPDEYVCTKTKIEAMYDEASGCKLFSATCPGKDMQVTLANGSNVIVSPRDVRCNGEWILDDSHHNHRVIDMICLNKGGFSFNSLQYEIIQLDSHQKSIPVQSAAEVFS
ncbi:hypothetical protein DICVIV_01487 [Dictyocaulus viviparus]|uniref:Uncharacterized protein n=1 Tax=Dictyocaulus viviparus TaxID=29172 RepID=A0A0D8Y6E1_DICVI|nr:hypothetical protein DICVIV_01487 [Dictyocaulus viviparus]